jgi:hypothetical protein
MSPTRRSQPEAALFVMKSERTARVRHPRRGKLSVTGRNQESGISKGSGQGDRPDLRSQKLRGETDATIEETATFERLFLTAARTQPLLDSASEIGRMLNGLIASLEASKG